MKKKISVSVPLFLCIVSVLLFSLFGNIIQFNKLHSEKYLQLVGSYSTNSYSNDCVYLVFDKDGHYYKYKQTKGLLEEGDYTEYAKNQYSLNGKSGENSQILLTDDGVYYVPQNDYPTFLPRFSDIPTFIGNWVNDWRKVSY